MIIENGVLIKVDEEDAINGLVTVPNGVVSIEKKAFESLRNLTTVVLPKSVKEIREYAFDDCEYLSAVVLPDGLERIGERAFLNCSSLAMLNIPDSVTNLENDVFTNCVSLKYVKLPETLEKIPTGLFVNCSNLEEVKIPSSVKEIGRMAFLKCKSLEKIEIPSGVEVIDNGAFSECTEITKIKLPESLSFLGDSAFSRCDKLEKINFPSNLKEIRQYAFMECKSLKEVDLPDNITSIGKSAFSKCYSLSHVKLPKNLEELNNQTFESCSILEKIEMPENLQFIDDGVFSFCLKLAEIKFPESLKYIGNQAFSDCINLESIAIPNLVEEIGIGAFSNCLELKSITLSKNLQFLKNDTFKRCDKLQKINIPSSVNFIGENCFEACRSLEKIEIPDKVLSLSNSTFKNCSNLAEVKLPKNLESIGEYCFSTCSNLSNIELPDSLKNIEKYAFNETALSKIAIPDSTISLGAYIFLGCEKLESVKLPKNLTRLSDGLLFNCASLSKIDLPSTVTYMGSYSLAGTSLEEVTIPENVEKINFGTFYSCEKLKNVNLSKSVKTVEAQTFDHCSNLKEVKFYNALKFLGNSRINMDYFEKTEDGFKLTTEQNETAIPKSLIKLNLAFLSRHWDKRQMLFNEQKNSSILEFYNSYLTLQPDSVIDEFLNAHNFTFFKQLNVPLNPEKVYNSYKFLHNIGALSTPIDINGKRIDYAQKIVGFLLEKEKKGFSFSTISAMFERMEADGFKPEFTDFFMSNFDSFVELEKVVPNFASRCYNEYERVQKSNTSNRGSQRQLKPTTTKFMEYFLHNNFAGVTEQNKEIADTLLEYFNSQETFDYALKIDKERVQKKVPNNILGEHLAEVPFENIDKLSSEIKQMQVGFLGNMAKIATNEFTFDWLEKNDPQNFILGKLCSCCAHIEGAGFGIMHASIVDPNVQNLVIRDENGIIVAKSTLYINPVEGYGVFNNVEVSEIVKENQKEEIYKKFVLGAQKFAENYNKKFPYKKLKQINVGMNLNDLETELKTHSTESKILFKAINYGKYGIEGKLYSGDSELEQYVVWKAPEKTQISEKNDE